MSQLKDGYIKYSNEEEREAAIKQAESLGFKEWPSNRRFIINECNAIYIDTDSKEWHDSFYEGNNEIPLNTKDYTDSETNCEGCMGPCGECKVEFTKKVKDAFKYPDLNPTFVDDFVVNYRGYSFNPDKYTKTESEDGTITLKPKTKLKLGLITYFDKKHNDFRATTLMPISVVKDYEKSLKKDDQKILLEVIERQYEL